MAISTIKYAYGRLWVATLALVLILGLIEQTLAQTTTSRLRTPFNFADNNNWPRDGGPIPVDDDEDSPSSTASLVWQPLPTLRTSFRPTNSVTRSAAARRQSLPAPPLAPSAPEPPSPPPVPTLPEALALIRGELTSGRRPPTSNNDNIFFDNTQPPSLFDSNSRLESLFSAASASAGLPTTTTTPQPATTLAFEEDDTPTRLPMNRFRPTRAPSRDEDDNSALIPSSGRTGSGRNEQLPRTIGAINNNDKISNQTGYQINQECFECICEASTNCNPQSRCQTSDVRHTRCGLFLITYEQWVASGLSKQLVSAEALARDVAADERAYYECVISRDCAEQLLSVYMAKKLVDCDKDGRLNCYDVAAIHQAGPENCRSESMLESQYWNDFNACYGFARR